MFGFTIFNFLVFNNGFIPYVYNASTTSRYAGRVQDTATDFGEEEPGSSSWRFPIFLWFDANYHPQSLWCHPGDW